MLESPPSLGFCFLVTLFSCIDMKKIIMMAHSLC
jgi:hypothetical protein